MAMGTICGRGIRCGNGRDGGGGGRIECRGGYNNVIPRCVLCYTERSAGLFWKRKQDFRGFDGVGDCGKRTKTEGLAMDAKILNLSCRNKKAAFVSIINV